MKLKIIAVVFLFLLGACHTYTHIGQVEQRWGPPAKVERTDDRIIHYYYFYGATGSAVGDTGWVAAEVREGWRVVEITTDLEGEILSKRKYWRQPELK